MKILLFIILMSMIVSCAKQEERPQQYTTKNTVVNIDDYQSNFPEGEGYFEFKSSCITCHSLRYIEMQPDFPEKTWDAIAKKMVKNFGAPIPDSTLTKVVHYLATVKGIE